MAPRSHRLLAGLSLTTLVLGASATGLADDAKKRELKLAICASTYTKALRACESQAQAEACYQKADAEDLACRKAEGAAGHSQVAPDVVQRRTTTLTRLIKKPLACGTGLNATCADGHARFPICERSGEQAINAGQGIAGQDAGISQDADGIKDRCSGQTIKCPAGFSLISRKGQDLCWDSVANKDKYAY